MKIVVLGGGLSSERTVSLVTSRSVCAALRQNGHRAIFVDLYLGVAQLPTDPESLFDAPDGLCSSEEISTQEPDLEALRGSRDGDSESIFGPHVLELCAMADAVFLGLHGRNGEDGRIQAAFDLLGIPYTGSGYLASALAMDKAMAKRLMESVGIPTPKWQLLHYTEADIDSLARTLPVPCVIKCTTGGSSLGVYLPETRPALKEALQAVSAYGGEVIMEERIRGRELTVGVLGNQALPAVEILPSNKEFNYEAKYQAGGARELCPAPITPEQQKEAGRLALLLHQTLGLQVYSRTDFLLDAEGRFWCLEVNSLPGLTGASLVPKEAAAIGLSYQQLCEEILQQSIRLERRG